LGSNLISEGIRWEETKIGRGPAFAKKPMELTDVTIASICTETLEKLARIKEEIIQSRP